MTFLPQSWTWWATLAVALSTGSIRSTPTHAGTASECHAPFVWGVTGHPTQQASYSSEESLEAQLKYLDQLGVSHYRLDLTVDTFGVVDSFHSGRSVSFDRVLTAAAAQDLQLLPVLTRRPDYRASPLANHRAAYLMARRFAARYGARLSQIEAGNETEDEALRYNVVVDSVTGRPDTSYWSGTDDTHYDPERLKVAIAFLGGMVQGIREAAPHLQIIINVAATHYGYFEALQRAGVDFDIYGLHWYSNMHYDAGGFAAVLNGLGRLPRPHLPVWMTEVNRRNGSQAEAPSDDQAAWIARLAAQLSGHPQVKAFFVYELLDQPAFGSSYGLVTCPPEAVDPSCTTGRSPKPAFERYRRVILAQANVSRAQAGDWQHSGPEACPLR